ncbi:MAG: SUMF1/EgtB/PvdO family nonheme iron enzyme [Magnetococcales bacterium]|nr:SUMF1/EgtB/PvdO family nonheme iron enzyme [Magnetococcales bacterium]
MKKIAKNKPAMAKKRSQGNNKAGLSAFFSGLGLKKSFVFGSIFIGASAIGWGLMSFTQEPDAPITWQSCLVEQSDGSAYPVMEEVPAGDYTIPTSLIGGAGRMISAEINTPFLVQSEEVKLGDFKKYAEYVENLPESKEKDRLMVRLGVAWQKNESNNSAVNAVSWEGARDYAHWLGQRTGCSYDIPSQDEWLATVSYLQARDKIKLNGSVVPRGPLKNLLWGVREWSRSKCSSGYYLLGRDDLTTSTHEEESVCMPAMFAVAGFRVIMTPASSHN